MDQRELKLILRLQDNMSKELTKISASIGGVQKNTAASSNSFASLGKSIMGAAAAYVSFTTAYNALSLGVKVAADLQTAQVGLQTLLGSAEKAQSTIDRLKKEAARTPFELPGLSQATQLLTSVTKDGDKSIDILLDIGEGLAAMGKGQSELDRIIVNLQQIAATGRAATIDIKQFAFAGIPIYEMLTETTGKSGEALEELVASGGVTFDLLTKMFDEANDEGGRFFNAYVNQAGTFNQATSNMKDAWGIFLSELVKDSGIFQGLTESMLAVAGTLQGMDNLIPDVTAGLQAFFAELDAKTGLVTMFNDVVANITFYFQEQFIPAWNELVEAAKPLQPLLEAIGQVIGFTLTVVMGALILVIQALALAFVELMTISAKYFTWVSNVWTGVIDGLGEAIFRVTNFVTDLINAFEEAIELAKELGGGAIDWVSGLLPGRASGGPVSRGQAYMVGEKGPEVFVPNQAGSIIPNNNLGGGNGGVVVNVYGDITGEDLIDRVIEGLGMDIKRRTRLAS